MDISDWRKRIDKIDRELAKLLSERSRCAIEVGRLKRSLNIPVYDPGREEKIFNKIIANNTGPLEDKALKRLFKRIIDESRRVERLEVKREKVMNKKITSSST